MYLKPGELQIGDQITMEDEGRRWKERVSAAPQPQESGKVFVWTDQRLVQLDPETRILVQRLAEPTVVTEKDN